MAVTPGSPRGFVLAKLTEVACVALATAASCAAIVLTTEAVVADAPGH